jgi:transposase
MERVKMQIITPMKTGYKPGPGRLRLPKPYPQEMAVMTTPRTNIRKTKHASNLDPDVFSMSAPHRLLLQQTPFAKDVPRRFSNRKKRWQSSLLSRRRFLTVPS